MIKDIVYAVSVVIQMVLKMTKSVRTQILCCRYYLYIISHLVDLQYPDRYFCLWTYKSHHVILVGNIVLVNWNQKINQEIKDVYPLQWGPHIKDIPHWTIWWTKPEISCYFADEYSLCLMYIVFCLEWIVSQYSKLDFFKSKWIWSNAAFTVLVH